MPEISDVLWKILLCEINVKLLIGIVRRDGDVIAMSPMSDVIFDTERYCMPRVDFSLCLVSVDAIHSRTWKSGERPGEFESRITNLMRRDAAICNSHVFARSNEI